MPARKTTAAQRQQALNRRKNMATLAIGAIPVAILLILGAIFLYNRATGLGPNEVPSTIGEGERAEIRKTIEEFYGFVNQYNPEFISSKLLPVPELGQEEFSRLVMEVAPLQSEALTFSVQTLGSTTLVEDGKYVQARVATNYGNREFRLTRRDGQWKLAAVPDLLVPQEAGPMRLEWAVTSSFVVDPNEAPPPGQATATATATATPAATGTATASQPSLPPQKTLFVVGRIKNLSGEPGYILSASAFITDGQGKTLVTARPPMPWNPYLDPGEEAYFQVQLTFPRTGEQLDVANFVLVPDFRQVGRTDEATFVTDLAVAEPPSVAWRPQTELSTTLKNNDPRPVSAQVFGYFLDGSGKPLFIVPVSPELAMPPGSSIPVPLAFRELPPALSGVKTIEFKVFATPPRPASR